MQIFDMSLKNALYSKAKLIMISLFISLGMVIFTLTIGISTVSLEQLSKNLEDLEQNNEMRITPRMSGGSIP